MGNICDSCLESQNDSSNQSTLVTDRNGIDGINNGIISDTERYKALIADAQRKFLNASTTIYQSLLPHQ